MSRLTEEDYRKIYGILDSADPLDTDCGKLCGAVCCSPEAAGEDAGIYLLPGEAALHDRSDPWLSWSADPAEEYDFPESWTGTVDFVRCKGAGQCRRELRPIQCRTFPLAPHLTEDGTLYMIMNDTELPYECPLITDCGRLKPEFVSACYEAWSLLITDDLIRDLVEEDSRFRDSCGREYVAALCSLKK